MPNSDVIARLARACAHGHRQLEFVNEMLAGEGYSRLHDLNWFAYGRQQQSVLWGDCRLTGKSWVSLKKRLVANGFMIKYGPWEDDYRTVELRFSV